MTPETLEAARLLTERGYQLRSEMPEYVPHQPSVKQAAFLSPPVTRIQEVLYGGAAGGGKSDALLMAALQFVGTPGYSALLLRRTYSELALEGAIMQRSHAWLDQSDARWSDRDHRWTFPSGATLTFGYLEHRGDEQRYASAEFQYIGFDELTQFAEQSYRFLFSRLRRLRGVRVPLRMRGATNPVGPGKQWVERRFILTRHPDRLFIPARIEDNPYLDADEYEQALRQLEGSVFRQLRYGDWNVKPEGIMFKREWFETVDAADVPPLTAQVRRWDLAATETPKGATARKQMDPDWSVGLLLGKTSEGIYYVQDVVRDRTSGAGTERMIRATAEADGLNLPVRMEQEPGSSGKDQISHYRRIVLDGFSFRGIPSSGSKEVRASPVAARAGMGEVKVVRGKWNDAFLDEVCEFPQGLHDDQVDALSGAYRDLSRGTTARAVHPQGDKGKSYWSVQ